MKFSISWLKDHLETDASPSEIADKLTSIGLEVEGITNPAELLGPFRIAKVLSAERHPQADKLQVLSVDAGADYNNGGPVQVVCGAPNARAGMLGVFGPPGAYVPGSDMTLKVAAIRSVESHGMMCSIRELQLGEEHDGIIELPADAPVGATYASWAQLDDVVLDVAVLPNRPDCLGVDGIARDLAAAGLGTLKPVKHVAITGSFEPEPNVIVEPDSGCYVFCRRVIRGVSNGPSPEWLQKRLKAVGLRPISALVDITNFFTVDQARPLHVYDVSKLQGDIVVRRGRKGERFLALNDKEYEATPEDCVIADDSGTIGFGGIVGGETTGVDESTVDVLLECAWFDPAMIGTTGRRHGINSDARARFERGIDPMKLATAIEDAARMITELCGGEASEPRMSGQMPSTDKVVAYRPERLAALGGMALEAKEQQAILGRLEFQRVEADAPQDSWSIRVPSWRPDIDGEADIVEEITRIAGYDRIVATALPRDEGVARPTATRAQAAERRLRRVAAARGLNEAINWSFISEEQADEFGGAADVLANPISADMSHMRPSLLPGLIAAARRNLDRGAASVRMFEMGRRYLEDGERATAAVLLSGERSARGWQSGKPEDFSAFDAKAEALALLDAAGAPVQNLQLVMDAGPIWHPGRAAKLGLGAKTILAAFGELHPSLTRGLPATVAAELYLDAIPAPRNSGRARAAFAPPLLQSVTRDFAFVVPDELAAETLVRAIRNADKTAITGARVFDRYQPEGGPLSLAIEVVLQPGEQSFTEAEIAEISKRIIGAAEKLGATLRS